MSEDITCSRCGYIHQESERTPRPDLTSTSVRNVNACPKCGCIGYFNQGTHKKKPTAVQTIINGGLVPELQDLISTAIEWHQCHIISIDHEADEVDVAEMVEAENELGKAVSKYLKWRQAQEVS